MTQISRDEVAHLAQLSGLHSTDDELDALGRDLSGILMYIQQLNELDTDDVQPTYQVTDLQNIWREDEVGQMEVSRQELLELAPESAEEQIKVPKVL